MKERGWSVQSVACRQTPNATGTLPLSQTYCTLESAAVYYHVPQHTHGDFAWPLEVVTTVITQGSGYNARES